MSRICCRSRMLMIAMSVAWFSYPSMTIAADVEPGGNAEATRMAIQESDEFAWQLFFWINRQALPGTAGQADPGKATVRDYDDNTDVVWETWALASRDGQPEAEVFLANGVKPPAWDDLPRSGKAPKKLDRNRTNAHRQLIQGAQRSAGKLAPQFVQTEPTSDEVRMNRATFEFVRDNYLYSRQGLAAAFAAGTAANNRDSIQFPVMAKEVKARWGVISEADKPRYHWKEIDGQIYGLEAFHIITKDLPMWFWTDFVHVDVDQTEPVPSVDKTTRGATATHGHDGIRDETVGSKWENYRLKGTQVFFTDARGKSTVLGNERIEPGNSTISSCVTCHSGAGVFNDGGGNFFPFFLGTPRPEDFGDGDTILVLQTDFLYSLPFRAQDELAPLPAPPAPVPAPAPAPAPAPEPAPAPAPANIKYIPKRQRVVEGFPNEMSAKLALRDQGLDIVADVATASNMTRPTVLTLMKRWGQGSTVTVAFKGGNTELHRKIADATKDWTNVANLKLDFGFNATTGTYRTWSTTDREYQAAIRISFDQVGYWSNVGRDSRDPQIAGPGEASMNFEDFAIALPGDWRGVVLHEFGHALGLEHEHQSFLGHCDAEFRWDDDVGYVKTRDSFGQYIQDRTGKQPGLYTVLGGPPNKWKPDTVNFNLRQLPNSSAFDTSAFDASSIMKYYFEAWMFKNGSSSSCYSPAENQRLSPQDIAGIQRAYPRNPAAMQAITTTRNTLLQRLENLQALPKVHLQNLK